MKIKNKQNLTPKNKYKKISSNTVAFSLSSANRGMSLEEDVIQSNEYYKDQGRALIYKRPTPIKILQVDYSKGSRITNACFDKKSTTDFNGVVNGRYVDIETKSTKNKTSFPLGNISKHQFDHLQEVIKHQGLAFFIIEFSAHQKTYLIEAKHLLNCYLNDERKSIPFKDFEILGYEIKRGYLPRLDYLPYIEEINRNS